ncbi:DUF4349 domain-containing protein [Parablastomonas sp. CN1-191]|uniref:DUF4349 domain-containing protein n=1 Tax=Parablastomonas sp. CN1-191 TaxID=3400908 RepID=UPI003BF7F4A6
MAIQTRLLVPVLAALVLAGCSKSSDEGSTKPPAAADRKADGSRIGVTGGDGIAVTYQYSVRIPASEVAGLQEEHARACEGLGPARCRIWGMTFSVIGDRSVAATLDLRLAPADARAFGRGAIDTATRRGGMLTDATIDSTDTRIATTAADAGSRDAERDRRALAARLAAATTPAERQSVQAMIEEAEGRQEELGGQKADAAASLAAIPLSLHYTSGPVSPPLDRGPFLAAIDDGWDNVVGGLAAILLIVITLLPWAAMALAVVLGGRWVVGRLWPVERGPTEARPDTDAPGGA